MYNKGKPSAQEVAAVITADHTATPAADTDNTTLDWHSVFFSTISIELDDELSHLALEREHQLTARPLRIDVVIIKKPPNYQVKKNIGRIFRGHNIVEYKSPDDYLSIDDSYKALSYGLLYKTDTTAADSIDIDDITLTLVSYNPPRKMLEHWQRRPGCAIETPEPGIYYIMGAALPMQVIVQRELSADSNLWLKCLTNNLTDLQLIGQVLRKSLAHEKDERFDAYGELISKANKRFTEEAIKMGVSTVLQEIIEETGAYKPYAEKARQEGIQTGIQKGIQKGRKEGRQEERYEVARSLLLEGAEVAFVAKITKLTTHEVKALAEDLRR